MEQSKEGNRIVNKERTMLSVPEGSVKRYAVFSVPPVIEEYRDGYFVNYDDYEVLKKKADALELEVHSLAAQLNFDVENDFTAENARLKTEVERLKAVSTIDQRTIQGLQNTPEWSEIARLTADYRELESKFRQASDERADYAKDIAILKAEVVQLTSERDGLFECNEGNLKECSRLKAEINSLRKESEMMDRERMSDEYDLNNQVRIINGLLTEKEKLKAEAERLDTLCKKLMNQHSDISCENIMLIKAGDEVIAEIEVSSNSLESKIRAWNAAKEGKQS